MRNKKLKIGLVGLVVSGIVIVRAVLVHHQIDGMLARLSVKSPKIKRN